MKTKKSPRVVQIEKVPRSMEKIPSTKKQPFAFQIRPGYIADADTMVEEIPYSVLKRQWATRRALFDRNVTKVFGDDEDTQPFRGFDIPKAGLKNIEIRSSLLHSLITRLKNEAVLESVAAITSLNKGGPVSVPPEYRVDLPEDVLSIEIISAAGINKSMQETVDELLKPLSAGWKRELIYKCVSDTKADIVQYLSPDGTELKNMQEIVEYLENIYGISDASGGLGPNNFSFHKSPLTNLGYDCQENIYVIDSAGKRRLVNVRQRKSPVRKNEVVANLSEYNNELTNTSRKVAPHQKEEVPRQAEISKFGKGVANNPNAQQFIPKAGNRIENNNPDMAGRQRIRRSALGTGLNRRTDDEMFTISAVRQNPMRNSGLGERRGQMRRDIFEGHNQFGNNIEEDEVLPCSIRCPGMTGKVPTLQCKSCLCLYHGACLGFPPNAKFVNFVCPNCDAKQNAPPPNKGNMNQNVLRQRSMAKSLNQPPPNAMITRRIGQTVISPEFQSIGRGGMSVRRMEIKPPELPVTRSRMAGLPTGNKTMMPKKGLWPSGKIPLPPLSSGGKSVTITPMGRIPKGRAPPLPNLHPMLPNNNNSLAPPPISGRANFNLRGMPKLPRVGNIARGIVPLPDLSRKRTAQSQGLVPGGPSSITRNPPLCPSQDKKNMTQQWAASTGQFRRLPQSIVTIGNKKFIAMPRGEIDTTMNQLGLEIYYGPRGGLPTDNGIELEGNVLGKDPEAEAFVLKKILPYLSIRDLLSASCVSHSWNQATSNKELWKTVRMKNAHIFDFEGFVNLLQQRETEILDLRKMAYESETDWNALAESLTKISSLKKVILASRSSPSSLIEMITSRCPSIEVVA